MNEDRSLEDIDFPLDSALIDSTIIKRIGISKSVNSILLEVNKEIILQTIHLRSFFDLTIKPLKNQVSEVLVGLKIEERRKITNSIVTCINRNISIISEHCLQSGINNSITGEESNKVNELIKIVTSSENLEKLFKDQYSQPYVAVRLNTLKKLEILAINNTRFKHYLSSLYRDNFGSCIGEGSLSTVITTLAAEAEIKGDMIPLHLRVSWGSQDNKSREECIYYDIGGSQGSIIEISKMGWRIIYGNDNGFPILFRKYNQLPVLEPDRNYPSNIFDQLIGQ